MSFLVNQTYVLSRILSYLYPTMELEVTIVSVSNILHKPI